jgi:serine/threonine-protein kinase
MPTMHTLAGEPVLEGKYHIECRLGQGGMGVVYKARHAFLKTQLAIKIILPDLVGNDPQLVTRFRQEALAAAAIRHQNVVGVTDYGVIDGRIPFLVMEYVEGESLHDLLARRKTLPADEALELISAIAAGVGAAHHQGIVHRDLKPLNIMICSDRPNMSQAVKILDFGLAKIKSGELLGSFVQAQTTGLMGSPYYMAPEQWADDDVDSRSDIYSLGVMLFQMLAGDVPFKGSSIPAIMKKHISDAPPTIASFGVASSPELEAAVARTLEKEPQKRTPTVEIMVEDLTRAIKGDTTTAQHMTSGQALPTSSLKIRTHPPQSKIFVDNVAVGLSHDSGELLLEGVQSGNHLLRVSHDGFHDWVGNVVCDGSPVEVVAELSSGFGADAIPKPGSSIPFVSGSSLGGMNTANTMRHSGSGFEGSMDAPLTGPSVPKRSNMPLVYAAAGLVGLFFILALGIGGAYFAGFIGGGGDTVANAETPKPSPTTTPSPAVQVVKPEMISIPGGTFKMGRNDGELGERPEHDVTVGSFKMDKTEVTNAEYLQFVKETKHVTPSNWSEGRPLPGTEDRPVSYVSAEDAIAFAKWRSKRDNVTYRLPTEEEWEYAARNGAKGSLYPWGDKWDDSLAVMNKEDSEPTSVGSIPNNANEWGIVDLIGNVWEWTGSVIKPYPGSNTVLDNVTEKRFVVRGGSAHENPAKLSITSTFRADVPVDQKEKNLGFRLVQPE